MSSDFCIKCDGGLSLYCGKCVDALRDELDVLSDKIIRLKAERDEAFAEIERLHARIESINAAHVAAIALMKEVK